jgi:hypothetical protein
MGPRKPNATANLPNFYALPFRPEECKVTNLSQTSLPTQDQKPQRSHAAAIEVSASPERLSRMNLLSGAFSLPQHLAPVLVYVPTPEWNLEQHRFQESARASSASHLTDYRLANTGATQQAT